MKRGFLNSSKVKNEPLYLGPSSRQAEVANLHSLFTVPQEPEQVAEKLPSGKFGIAAPPKSYKSVNTTSYETDVTRTDYPANVVVVTTIPSKTHLVQLLDPDGHTQWILVGATKAKVLNAPGYPQRVPKPVGLTPYVVKSTPNMGIGVFATRDIQVGELIFTERPLLVAPRNLGLLGLNLPKQDDPKTFRKAVMWEWEKMLQAVVGRMTPENQAAFKSLINNHQVEDGSGPLSGILHSNCYGIDELFDGEESHPDGITSYSAVTRIGSRLNHSCMPNVAQNFTLPSFSVQFTATRDIKAGEQLYFPYCAISLSVAERQVKLAPYCFECACPACANATPETDKLRKEYRQRTQGYMRKVQKLIEAAHVAESAIDPVLKFREVLIKEGLNVTAEYKMITLMIGQFYAALGLHEKEKSYMEEYERYDKAALV